MRVSGSSPTMSVVLQGIESTTKNVEHLQKALATRQKHLSYGEMGGDADAFASSQTRRADAQGAVDQILLTKPILSASTNLVTSLKKIAEQGAKMVDQLAAGQLGNLDGQAQGNTYLNTTIDLLNTRVNGLSITSGSDSTKDAWDKSALQAFNTYTFTAADDQVLPPGYQGDSFRKTLPVNGQVVEISMTGNEMGPQRMVRAFHIMANAVPGAPGSLAQTTYITQMTEARRILGQACLDFENIETRLGVATKQIEDTNKMMVKQDFQEQDYQGELNGVRDVEAYPQMMAGSNQLQTLYSVVNKQNQLTESLLAIMSR